MKLQSSHGYHSISQELFCKCLMWSDSGVRSIDARFSWLVWDIYHQWVSDDAGPAWKSAKRERRYEAAGRRSVDRSRWRILSSRVDLLKELRTYGGMQQSQHKQLCVCMHLGKQKRLKTPLLASRIE
jgi:hypothetical protein